MDWGCIGIGTLYNKNRLPMKVCRVKINADYVDCTPASRPQITWMKKVLNDIESLTEAVNMTQNRPLWRLLATSIEIRTRVIKLKLKGSECYTASCYRLDFNVSVCACY